MSINFVEQQVTINGDVELKGTLTIPDIEGEKFPAVVMINGSGGADRDGNMKKPPMKGNIYRNLAHFITSLGFITLRYDKRGIGESKGDPYTAGMMDLVNDINSNVKFLQNYPKVDKDKIILVGHSEGCILATVANSIVPVGGMVLLSGAGTNLREPLRYQNSIIVEEVKKMRGLKGAILRLVLSEKKLQKQQDDLYDKMVSSTGDTIRVQFKKMPAKWFREHFSYSNEDILKLLSQANCSILAITGDKDVQANVKDLKKVEALNKDNIKCVPIEKMDHMLKEFKGEKTILNLIKQYKAETSKPMHPELETVLKNWLKQF